MEKWVRRSMKATLTAGVVGLCTANLAAADDTTVVVPEVDSESASAIGDNSILGGNAVSAPITAPITGNDVAVAGIGGAVNAEQVLAALGIAGEATAGECGDDDVVEVAPQVSSSTTSMAGDNSIGSANAVSAPVTAPVTGNDVAVAGIGGAVNAEDVAALVGVLGSASCDGGDGGDGGDDSYATASSDDIGTEALPVGGLAGAVPSLGGLTNALPVDGVTGGLPDPASLVDQVVSLVGLGGLRGVTGLTQGLPNVAGVDPAATVDDAAGSAATLSDTQTAEMPQEAAAETSTAEQNASDPVATTHATGDDSTTVASSTSSQSAGMAGDNSIGSGNSVSVPVDAPVTGNDVSVAGIGAAVNAESVEAAVGVLGTATSLLE